MGVPVHKDLKGWLDSSLPLLSNSAPGYPAGPGALKSSSFPRPLLSNGTESFGLEKTFKIIRVQPDPDRG